MELQIMKKQNMQKAIKIVTVAGIVIIVLFIIYGIQTKIFISQSALEIFLGRFGVWTPIIFILFQAVQVVFPAIPGGIGFLVGTVIFGSVKGFFLNYIGICLGSIAAFLIARKYGKPIIESLFSFKLQKKYAHWTEDKKFTTWFAIAIFMPIAPDDYLCYMAGTTKMSFETFTMIILLGKPLTLAVYSFGLTAIFNQVITWFH